MNMALVARILTNALRRTYEEELAAELAALGTVVVDAETKARVWARVEESLNAKGRTGRLDPLLRPTKNDRRSIAL